MPSAACAVAGGATDAVALTIPLAAPLLASARHRSRSAIGRRGSSRPTQPTKLAAFEGLYRTTPQGAPEHTRAGTSTGRSKFGIPIPHLFSLLAFHGLNATVQGLAAVPLSDRPPDERRPASRSRRWSGSGRCSPPSQSSSLVCSSAAGAARVLALLRARRRSPAPLSLVALIAGWVVTEVGRQPWVVFHVMRTAQAVTGAGGIPVGYATLAASYVIAGSDWPWVRAGWRAPRSSCRFSRRAAHPGLKAA